MAFLYQLSASQSARIVFALSAIALGIMLGVEDCEGGGGRVP
ncbi:MAG TPA: hypothetical protein VLA77_00340 [Candidatus Saccharimonadales bacterium]|nr:hypothetical protein [Candidatus Saccharimonadales bacterium]